MVTRLRGSSLVKGALVSQTGIALTEVDYYDRFFLASNNNAESERDQREVLRVLQASPDQTDKIAQYFYERTRKLIVAKSYTLADKGVKFVDIFNEVLRYVPLYWTATELVCNREAVLSDITDS